jgi:hypothetical protein
MSQTGPGGTTTTGPRGIYEKYGGITVQTPSSYVSGRSSSEREKKKKKKKR